MKHGWVTPNPDGSVARCGGPGACKVCQDKQRTMNDTKVQRYEVVSSAYGYFLGMRTELAAAHLENKRLTSLLAKYQRLHAADVREALEYVDDFIARCNGDARGSCSAVNVLRAALAMEALA